MWNKLKRLFRRREEKTIWDGSLSGSNYIISMHLMSTFVSLGMAKGKWMWDPEEQKEFMI